MAGAGDQDARADRVVRSHRQAIASVWLALVFVAAALAAAATGEPAWMGLHLFLAGGLVLTISGVSLMLTVTWSSAPAPPGWVVLLQRACIAGGAVAVVAARRQGAGDGAVVAAGAVYVAGLALLAALLVWTARRGKLRRYDPAVLAYVLAAAAGSAGAVLGVVLLVDGWEGRLRAAHQVVNLLGLVGLVIVGTLPFFAATVGRVKMARHTTRERLLGLVAWHAAAVVVATAGIASGTAPLARAGLAASAVGLVAVLAFAPRLTRKQLAWAGPRLLGLWAGVGWWAVAVTAAAAGDLPLEHGVVFEHPWLSVLVVAGFGQVLWGSLAYVLPVLRGGGPERLAEGFAATRSWVGLVAANLAGVCFVAGLRPVAVAAVAVWAIDTGVRLLRAGR